MTTSRQPTIDLGDPQRGVSFDTAFAAAKTVLDTFHVETASFIFNDTRVNVEQFTSAAEAFEAYDADHPDGTL